VLQGIDKHGTLLGTVEHDKGSIATELLRAGLAKVRSRHQQP
jgi:endonuclease YncB( thermonuclease family)